MLRNVCKCRLNEQKNYSIVKPSRKICVTSYLWHHLQNPATDWSVGRKKRCYLRSAAGSRCREISVAASDGTSPVCCNRRSRGSSTGIYAAATNRGTELAEQDARQDVVRDFFRLPDCHRRDKRVPWEIARIYADEYSSLLCDSFHLFALRRSRNLSSRVAAARLSSSSKKQSERPQREANDTISMHPSFYWQVKQ